MRRSQSGVFRLGLREDRKVGIGVLPEIEEVLVSSLCLCHIPRQSQGTGQLQACQRADGIAKNDPRVIENPPEFGRGLGSAVRGQIRLAPDIDRIQTPEIVNEVRPGHGQIVRTRTFERLQRLIRIALTKRNEGAQHGQLVILRVSVLGKLLVQLTRKLLSVRETVR